MRKDFITIYDVAEARGAIIQPDNGCIEGSEFARLRLPLLGGCCGCEASLAAYNMYPSKSGYVVCAECVGEINGFKTVAEFEAFEEQDASDVCRNATGGAYV
jgi:hypothetical protein